MAYTPKLKNSLESFLKPTSSDPDIQGREIVLNYLLFGSCLIAIFAFFGVTTTYILGINQENYSMTASVCFLFFIAMFGLYIISHVFRRYKFAAFILLGIYFLISTSLSIRWGLQVPISILLFGFVIVTAGVLVNSRYSLYAVFLTVVVMMLLEYLFLYKFIEADVSWKKFDSNYSDVFGFFVVYSLIALVSWLFNRQMEKALTKARKSELQLQEQNNQLERIVSERTNELAIAQIEKVEQIYQFAELGRISSALFHDLASHISSVSLDIEGLHHAQNTQITKRAQETMKHLDSVVHRVRKQLRGKRELETFDIILEINEVLSLFKFRSKQLNIRLYPVYSIATGSTPKYKNDLTRFRQIINNLVTNSMEAYENSKSQNKHKNIIVEVKKSRSAVEISVTDFAAVIKKSTIERIFDPFYSTKNHGSGIGLFVVKQIVTKDFGGEIDVVSTKKDGTIFKVSIPILK